MRNGNIRKITEAISLLMLLVSCARMGSPDGGWYDDTPPRVVGASPSDGGTDVRTQKIAIHFNEYIKLDDPQSKVIISPPQMEMPEIRATGKRILVELKDTLKPATTYTVDFSDAISDNNENNPMGNYTYSFSTGGVIDTLQVSGYCLSAENLEPVKGILVGLYPTDSLKGIADTTFHTQPFQRVSRTNGSGQFTIKGVAPGSYFAYALQDADGNFVYNQKSEMIGYSHVLIEPTSKPDFRKDTLWRDSLHIDSIMRVPYTHFLPDDVTLLCFQEPQTDRFLIKTERKDPERIDFFFTYGSGSLPVIRGLNFAADSAFVIEPSEKRDTVSYWLRDSLLINQDTLAMEVRYLMTDSTGLLVMQTDTIEALPKTSYEKRMKAETKEFEKWQKEQEKRKKRGEPYDSIMPCKPLVPKVSASGQIDPTERIRFEMPTPLSRCDTASVHLYSMIDSVWYRAPHLFRQTGTRTYELLAEWRLGVEYSLEIDSAAFVSIYGLASNAIKKGLKVKTEDDYSSLVINLSGFDLADYQLPQEEQDSTVAPVRPQVIVQLLDKQDNPVRSAVMNSEDRTAEFYYLTPGQYYLRAFIDQNGNGIWDTGCYDENRQAEPVFYNKEQIDCKQKWDVTRSWNLTATPRHQQKPAAITKQKPDQQKQLKNRNLDRARELGKQYVPKM